jgi:hypothetical protein
MLPASQAYPRNCSIYGSEHIPSALGAASVVTTCGVLVFATPDGNEYYIFMDGLTPALGGVNEVMAGGIGSVGCDLGPPVTPGPNTIGGYDGLSVLGGERVSSSVAIASGVWNNTPICGALALMTAHGNAAGFLFMSKTAANTWQLEIGTEAQWLAGTGGLAVGTPVVGSGALGLQRDGRTVIGNSRRDNAAFPPCVFVVSGGRGAGFAFEFGGAQDQGKAVIMYFPDPQPATPLFVVPSAFITWNNS